MSRMIRTPGLIFVVRSSSERPDASGAFVPGQPALAPLPRSAVSRGAPSSNVGVADGKETT